MLQRPSASNCPFCANDLSQKEILYRCVALPQVCSPEVDTLYSRFIKESPPQPRGILTPKPKGAKEDLKKLFGQAAPVRCQRCATPTPQQVCPHCHSNLPMGFDGMETYAIGFVARDDVPFQKFLSGLHAQLLRIAAHDIGATLKPSHVPNGIHLTFDQKSAALRDKKCQNILLTFHFIPFHSLKNPTVHEYMAKMQGVLFAESGAWILNGDIKTAQDFVTHISTLSLKCPKGLLLTDLEQWGGALPHAAIIRQVAPHVDGYNQEDGRIVSNELQAQLGAKLGVNVLRSLKEMLHAGRLFSLSLQNASTGVVPAYARLIDPVLWLMYQWGILKAVGPKRDA